MSFPTSFWCCSLCPLAASGAARVVRSSPHTLSLASRAPPPPSLASPFTFRTPRQTQERQALLPFELRGKHKSDSASTRPRGRAAAAPAASRGQGKGIRSCDACFRSECEECHQGPPEDQQFAKLRFDFHSGSVLISILEICFSSKNLSSTSQLEAFDLLGGWGIFGDLRRVSGAPGRFLGGSRRLLELPEVPGDSLLSPPPPFRFPSSSALHSGALALHSGAPRLSALLPRALALPGGGFPRNIRRSPDFRPGSFPREALCCDEWKNYPGATSGDCGGQLSRFQVDHFRQPAPQSSPGSAASVADAQGDGSKSGWRAARLSTARLSSPQRGRRPRATRRRSRRRR